MNLFFDTSALVKYFHRESGSDAVENMIDNSNNSIWISELSRIEFVSAIHKKYRTREINLLKLNETILGFEEEMSRFKIEPLNSKVVSKAEILLKSYGRKYSLRTLDAVQLAVFSLIAENDWKFILADENLYQIILVHGLNAEKV